MMTARVIKSAATAKESYPSQNERAEVWILTGLRRLTVAAITLTR